jgi:hypothetical protein
MRMFFVVSISCLLVSQVFAHDYYTGRSGAPGTQTCAGSCHGSSGGTVTITGFPSTYVPNQSYLLTIQHAANGDMANFNASCRVLASNAIAGVITAGTGTATYNVASETNGVHFATSFNNVSGTFTWTAPAAGTGAVRLYAGALQGTNSSGFNSTIVLNATEGAALPAAATSPNPADMATGVPLSTTISWTAGSGATSHDVYLGTANPPAFIGNQATTSYAPVALLSATTYFWRIDERNGAGVTSGTMWQFITVAPPAAPANLVVTCTQPDVHLWWQHSSGAASYQVYRDVTPGVALTPANLIATTTDTSYVDVNVVSHADLMLYYAVTASNP